MPAEQAERNQRIVDQHRAGASRQELADRFGITVNRVGAIIRRAEERDGGGARSRRRGQRGSAPGETVRLRIGNMAKAVLVTGQAYQDPKDALNEFVSNAADEYAVSERRGRRIRVVLRRKGKNPVIAIDDDGAGMGPDRLRAIAQNLFESGKAGDDRTLGEKAIGILGFQQLGGRCEIVSRAEGSPDTWSLRLERGQASASLTREKRRARPQAGTTVYLSQLDAEVLRMLTVRKVVDYLRRRRGAALARGDYQIEVVEGRSSELVTPEEPEGVRLSLPPQSTLWGRIEYALYVAAEVDRSRRVAVVGRAGTTIIDSVTDLEELDHEPWTSGQVSGQIVFEALQQSAGRRAVLRDDDAFPVFRDAVTGVEPLVTRTLEKVRQELDEGTADRLSATVRQIFGRVLRELADLENPMRTPVGPDADGQGVLGGGGGDATGEGPSAGSSGSPAPDADGAADGGDDRSTPSLGELAPDPAPSAAPGGPTDERGGGRDRSRHLPTVAPDPEPGPRRSRFDPERGLVFYNEHHADYLLVKADEPSLLDYLATLVAKEYVVFNNPRASSEDVGEEMVRMLVRVRRHLPRRR